MDEEQRSIIALEKSAGALLVAKELKGAVIEISKVTREVSEKLSSLQTEIKYLTKDMERISGVDENSLISKFSFLKENVDKISVMVNDLVKEVDEIKKDEKERIKLGKKTFWSLIFSLAGLIVAWILDHLNLLF